MEKAFVELTLERPDILLLASSFDLPKRHVVITSVVETYSVILIRELYLRVIHGNSLLGQKILEMGELNVLYEEVLKWLMEMGEKMDKLKPVSGEIDTLTEQARNLQVSFINIAVLSTFMAYLKIMRHFVFRRI